MFKKSMYVLLALSLFGCAAGSQLYTKDEENAIMREMQSKATPKLYLYAPTFLKFTKHSGEPFECALDGNAAGGIRLGDYVVVPVKPGDHTLICKQNVDGAGLATSSTNGSLAFKIEKNDLYIMVKNGLFTWSSLKLAASNTPPDNFSEEYELSKTCAACAKN